MTFFLDEQDASAQWSMLWMARLIHVRKALEARGYPPGLEAAVEFRVEDALLPTNSRAYRMEVSGGQARGRGIARTMARRRNAEIGIEGRSGASDSGVTVHSSGNDSNVRTC